MSFILDVFSPFRFYLFLAPTIYTTGLVLCVMHVHLQFTLFWKIMLSLLKLSNLDCTSIAYLTNLKCIFDDVGRPLQFMLTIPESQRVFN